MAATPAPIVNGIAATSIADASFNLPSQRNTKAAPK